MILVPLTSVLYVLSLASFVIAGYYGFRLVTYTRRSRMMVMISHDGPNFILGGVIMLAISQGMNLIQSVEVALSNVFVVASVALLMSSSFMFAKGFHTIYAVYRNESLRSKLYSELEGVEESESAIKKKDWKKDLR